MILGFSDIQIEDSWEWKKLCENENTIKKTCMDDVWTMNMFHPIVRNRKGENCQTVIKR